jgi:hypothetical protein
MDIRRAPGSVGIDGSDDFEASGGKTHNRRLLAGQKDLAQNRGAGASGAGSVSPGEEVCLLGEGLQIKRSGHAMNLLSHEP